MVSVIALLQKIESAFNFVWQVEHLRSLSQRFSNYLSVILIGPVLVFAALGITATMMNNSRRPGKFIQAKAYAAKAAIKIGITVAVEIPLVASDEVGRVDTDRT